MDKTKVILTFRSIGSCFGTAPVLWSTKKAGQVNLDELWEGSMAGYRMYDSCRADATAHAAKMGWSIVKEL